VAARDAGGEASRNGEVRSAQGKKEKQLPGLNSRTIGREHHTIF
jgi:hypothetical protein